MDSRVVVIVAYDSLVEEDIWDVDLFKTTDVFVEDEVVDVLDLSTEMSDVGEVWNREEWLWLCLLFDEVASSSEQYFQAV